jgi:uncharacterized protein YjiS (DUF1127 family)
MFYAPRSRIRPDAPAIGLAGTLRTAGTRLVLALLRWQELARQRRRLLAMDDRMLKDLGLSRADAHREGQRPFWDDRGVVWTPWR